MKAILKRAGLTVGIAASLTLAVVAQQQQQSPTTSQTGTSAPEQRGRMGGHHRGMGKAGRGMRGEGGERGMKMFRDLNLTDAQKQQLRLIHEKTNQGTEAQRTELRGLMQQRRQGGQFTPEQEARARQLQSEMREAHKGVRNEMLGVLTAEQRTQLKAKRQELKQRRQEMRGRGMDEENDEQP